MKVKIICANTTRELEEKVNFFIKDLEVVSVSFNTSPDGLSAYILYKLNHNW